MPEVKVDGRSLKMRYQLVDSEEDNIFDSSSGNNSTSQQNVSAYYNQPDCFILLYRVVQSADGIAFDEKAFKNNHLSRAKGWIETRIRKKQEWLFILMVDGVMGKEKNEVN